MGRTGTVRALLFLAALAPAAQGASVDTLLGIERLQRLGSVLMIGAHPDDEYTALLAYMARGAKYRTAYLSLTRGEGGQNLIGPEQGEAMGLIRTHELLAARRIDGAEQFFTRAIDFGFSKTAEEALKKWGREEVLADVVLTIRRFRPDAIVLVFSGTPRDGHGQHQASAILGKEAFFAAADPNRFPEQLKDVQPWKAKRVYQSRYAFNAAMQREIAAIPDRIVVDAGRYDPRLGMSFAELAGASRSMHRSQAMGSGQPKGAAPVSLTWVAGDRAAKDLFEGVDTTWRRVTGGEAVDAAIQKAHEDFRLEAPERAIPALLEARRKMAAIDDAWARRKKQEVEDMILGAAGIWLDASAARPVATPRGRVSIKATAVNRSAAAVSITGFQIESVAGIEDRSVPVGELKTDRPVEWTVEELLTPAQPLSQPYWLREAGSDTMYKMTDLALRGAPEQPAALRARFRLRFGDQEIEAVRPVEHRYVDPARGELTRPLAVAPAVAVDFGESSLLFASGAPRQIRVQLRANQAGMKGTARLEAPAGWTVTPATRGFRLDQEGSLEVVTFEVVPGAGAGELRAVAETAEGKFRHGMRTLGYEHIPPVSVFPEAKIRVARTDVKVLSKSVGYVAGAGDRIPEALRQLGVEVTLLSPADLAGADLGRFDAIVTGVRAFNVRKDLEANVQRLFDYVAAGGTMIVQYNTVDFRSGTGPAKAGPYKIEFGNGRVTVEEAPLKPVNADHPLLREPNRIEPADYEGWVQERGLYFASNWDAKYEPLWETSDPGERPMRGATLYARHGKGVYIFTAISWFRQLPAGVPGATRIFANFLSASKLTP